MLLRQILDGSQEAFERLVRKHYQNIFAYCWRRTFDRETAADLTQEVFLKLVSTIYRYRFSGKFSNFLLTIAVNTCNDHFRRLRREPAFEAPPDAETPDPHTPEDAALLDEENALLRARLRALPEEQQNALLLYYFHGCKLRDVAKITGVPLGTAKSRIRDGLKKLRREYDKEA